MKVVIIEDEFYAAELLKLFMQSYTPSVKVIKVISSCKELQSWLQMKEDADLLFCDIELSDGNVLNSLKKEGVSTPVIFTTAYDRFWKNALALNGIDYLLKPLSEVKVHAVLDKVAVLKKSFNKDGNRINEIAELLNRRLNNSYKNRFAVRFNNEVFVLETESIIFFRILDGMIFAFTEGNKKYPLLEETLNDLETKLNPEYFFRINRAEIINVRYLLSVRISEGSDYSISLKMTNEKLVVSNSRKTELKEWLDNPEQFFDTGK